MYAVKKHLFTEAYLSELMDKLVSSPYLARSPLGKEFVSTKGFSIVFTRSELQIVLSEFPYLKPFLENVLFDKCNAFYVNPLFLEGGSRVDPHIDCRLVTSENVRIIPNLVSVLYVYVESDIDGGEFILNVGGDNEEPIKPITNHLLYFRGNIIHSVNEVRGSSKRVSLVCEQYNLPESILEAFPSFQIIEGKDENSLDSYSQEEAASLSTSSYS